MKILSISKKSSFFLIVLVGFIIGICAYSYGNANKLLPQNNMSVSNPNFPVNELGETYGSARDVSPYEKEPDLIKAMGVNGKIGYVRLTELNGEEPKTVEEALAQQAKKEVRVINLYKSDGKTIIDKFEIKPTSEDLNKESE